MKFIDAVKKIFKNFSTLARPSPELRRAFGGLLSKVGINVNVNNALQITAVFACVRLLSESIASLPLTLYKETESGREKAKDVYLYRVLHDKANPEADSFVFWQVFVANMLIYGRGYAEKVYDNAGNMRELWNITTPNVNEKRDSETKELYYEVTAPNGEIFRLRKEQIFKVDFFSLDGINVYKPLKLAQNAIALAIASEEYACNYFKNGANVSAIVEYPDEIEENSAEEFRKSVREKYAGLSNTARIMFLEQGSKFTKISNSPQESQMTETRKNQIEEIARFYNVPLHMIGDLDHATFSNIEQMSLNFVIYTLRTYLVRIEKAIGAQLLTDEQLQTMYVKFSCDALLRGDYKSRMDGYAVARQNGWMSTNDIRRLEDMNLVPKEDGGDEYLANGNLRSLRVLMNASAEGVKKNEN